MFELYEQIHGLQDLQFLEVMHKKNERVHWHRVYNRVSPDTLVAQNLSWTKIKNERVCRQLEVEFGHQIIPGKNNRAVIHQLEKEGEKEAADKLRHLATVAPAVVSLTHAEAQQVKRTPLKQVRTDLAEAWRISDDPEGFKQAVEEHDYAFTHGNKVPLAVDADGKKYPLLRSINAGRKALGLAPIKKAELDERLPVFVLDPDAIHKVQIELEQRQTQRTKIQPMDESTTLKLQPATGKKDELIGCKLENAKAKNDKHERDKWKQHLLSDYYGKQIDESELTKYWRPKRQHNGSLKLSNRTGEIIDHGCSIDVKASGFIKGNSYMPAAAAALELARLKGWNELKVCGEDEFKKTIFILAIEKGVRVSLECEYDRKLWEQIEGKVNEQDNSVPQSLQRSPAVSQAPGMQRHLHKGQMQG